MQKSPLIWKDYCFRAFKLTFAERLEVILVAAQLTFGFHSEKPSLTKGMAVGQSYERCHFHHDLFGGMGTNR
jgi:hypothetical protein